MNMLCQFMARFKDKNETFTEERKWMVCMLISVGPWWCYVDVESNPWIRTSKCHGEERGVSTLDLKKNIEVDMNHRKLNIISER